jgi:hypothetical protein
MLLSCNYFRAVVCVAQTHQQARNDSHRAWSLEARASLLEKDHDNIYRDPVIASALTSKLIAASANNFESQAQSAPGGMAMLASIMQACRVQCWLSLTAPTRPRWNAGHFTNHAGASSIPLRL